MFKLFLSIILCVAIFGNLAAAAAASQDCPVANGTYAVSGSCDEYVECKNGIAEQKVCPDGLLFNERSTGYPCAYPIDVECAQPNARLQPAQATEDCPHQFGYYRVGDAKHCGQFKNCAAGVGYLFDCPEGLAWNAATYKCDWPDQAEDCDAEAYLGFRCPAPARKPADFGDQEEEYQFYASPDNCQTYFICIENRPRRIGCGLDQAFNPELNQCDSIENVPSCSPEVKARGEEIRNARLAAAKARQAAKQSTTRSG